MGSSDVPPAPPQAKPALFAGGVGLLAMAASCVIMTGHPQVGATAFVLGAGFLMIVVNLYLSRLARAAVADVVAAAREDVTAARRLKEELQASVQSVEVMKAAVNRRWLEAQADLDRLHQVMERDLPERLADELKPLLDDMRARRERDAEDAGDGTRRRDSWLN
ncbi:hypothetical protein ACRYCC_15795 [Actinomadura scrupuli]|uniref:hypothetical protein n=1 Tax=Actinomadura scrupuli TaxID=559629 RepID=UPI003D96363D